MTWFRVDDGFSDHPKVKAIPRTQRAAACGLWVLAGSWCSAKLTEGRVPTHMIADWGCSVRSAEALVLAGLWTAVDGGYQFHDWTQANPTRDQVLGERAAATERQRRARERAAEQRASRRDNTVTAPSPEDVSRRDKGVSHGPPDPTRPDQRSKHVSPSVPESPARDPARTGRVDPKGFDGHPRHAHHDNARAWCVRIETERSLPIDAATLLAWCYRLGDGDPWAGHRIVDDATNPQLDTANNPTRALRARLHAATPRAQDTAPVFGVDLGMPA